MNDEETRSSPVMIQRDQETTTGKRAANCSIDGYEQVSNTMMPNNSKHQVHDEIKNHQADQDPPEYINSPLNAKEFEEALEALKDKIVSWPRQNYQWDVGTPWHQSKVQTPRNLQ